MRVTDGCPRGVDDGAMSAAQTSITGFTIIPSTDRVARPRGRRIRPGLLERLVTSLRSSTTERRAWNARVAAERAAAPPFYHPRDVFTLRHPDDEIRRL